jgi:hypothetical protein
MAVLKIIFLFFILGAGILFLTKKLHFSQFLAPLVTICGITTILYIFSLANFLYQGVIFTIVLLILLGIISFINWPKNGSHEKWKISPALVAWIIVFFVIAFFTIGTLFYAWDEFTYWGVIYKYLMATNHLPDLASNFFITNYPPFTALFQYFVAKIIGNQESSAYFAQLLMSFAAIIAILPVKKWRGWKKYTLVFVISCLSVFLFDFKFQSLYVDQLIALFFAAGLSSALFNKNLSADRTTTVIFASIALILSKPLNILFALVLVVILYADYLHKNFELDTVKKFFKSIFKPLAKPQIFILITLSLIAAVSWNVHTAQFNNKKVIISINEPPVNSADIFPWYPDKYTNELINQDAASREDTLLFNHPQEIKISFAGLLRNFTINAPYRTKLIISSFITNIAVTPYWTSHIPVLVMLMIILGISFLSNLLMKKERRKEHSLTRTNFILLAGIILYSLLLFFAYIYYFGQSDGTTAPSLQRYLASYVLGWWLLVICSIYLQDSSRIPGLEIDSSTAMNSVLLLIMLFVVPVSTYLHLPETPDVQRFKVNQIYEDVAGSLTAKDKVYDVWQVDSYSGLYHYMMKYFLTPIPSNNYGWQLGQRKKQNDDLYTTPLTPNQWLKFLNDQHYTYVLVSTSDYAFWQRYGSIFDTYSEIKTNEGVIVPQLFSVTSKGLVNVPLDLSGFINNSQNE